MSHSPASFPASIVSSESESEPGPFPEHYEALIGELTRGNDDEQHAAAVTENLANTASLQDFNQDNGPGDYGGAENENRDDTAATAAKKKSISFDATELGGRRPAYCAWSERKSSVRKRERGFELKKLDACSRHLPSSEKEEDFMPSMFYGTIWLFAIISLGFYPKPA
jgi:hypothetical protein